MGTDKTLHILKKAHRICNNKKNKDIFVIELLERKIKEYEKRDRK